MHASTLLSLLPLLAVSSAAPMDDVKRAVSASCPSYTIINTRGTGEAQGPSAGFRTMNGRIIAALSGGKIYNTVYPAGVDQYSAAGTQDIINKITSTLASSPNECFILEGYSQGAAATVNAMPRLTGANLNAVKGVFLIGDPAHKAGLTCNVDNNGGTTTRNVNGLSARIGTTIPSNWVSKTLDVCILVSAFLLLDMFTPRRRNSTLTRYFRVMVYATLRTARASTHSICSTPTTRPRRTWVPVMSPSSWEAHKLTSRVGGWFFFSTSCIHRYTSLCMHSAICTPT
ncbi:Acetylxylan esterase [Ascochyta rabiei]|uniref:Acetylxylan esterase n=1 Tax=Didymella rabiei TaxID=5454 RepID=UPI00220904AA|nr:Acetylxylan esterase [Ascochyta rabiei]UPX16415.1 Acetylxylan esterase [Ascochyta rabiei]